MKYRADKNKLLGWCRRHWEPHQKQYVPLPFGGGRGWCVGGITVFKHDLCYHLSMIFAIWI